MIVSSNTNDLWCEHHPGQTTVSASTDALLEKEKSRVALLGFACSSVFCIASQFLWFIFDMICCDGFMFLSVYVAVLHLIHLTWFQCSCKCLFFHHGGKFLLTFIVFKLIYCTYTSTVSNLHRNLLRFYIFKTLFSTYGPAMIFILPLYIQSTSTVHSI